MTHLTPFSHFVFSKLCSQGSCKHLHHPGYNCIESKQSIPVPKAGLAEVTTGTALVLKKSQYIHTELDALPEWMSVPGPPSIRRPFVTCPAQHVEENASFLSLQMCLLLAHQICDLSHFYCTNRLSEFPHVIDSSADEDQPPHSTLQPTLYALHWRFSGVTVWSRCPTAYTHCSCILK